MLEKWHRSTGRGLSWAGVRQGQPGHSSQPPLPGCQSSGIREIRKSGTGEKAMQGEGDATVPLQRGTDRLLFAISEDKVQCCHFLPPAGPELGPGCFPSPGASPGHPGNLILGIPGNLIPGHPRPPQPWGAPGGAARGTRRLSLHLLFGCPPPSLAAAHRHKLCSQGPCPACEPGARLQPVPGPPWLLTGWEPGGSRLGTKLQAHRPARGSPCSSPLLPISPQFKCWKRINQTKGKAAKLKLVCGI